MRIKITKSPDSYSRSSCDLIIMIYFNRPFLNQVHYFVRDDLFDDLYMGLKSPLFYRFKVVLNKD